MKRVPTGKNRMKCATPFRFFVVSLVCSIACSCSSYKYNSTLTGPKDEIYHVRLVADTTRSTSARACPRSDLQTHCSYLEPRIYVAAAQRLCQPIAYNTASASNSQLTSHPTYKESRLVTPSTHDLISCGKNPNINSIAPRTSLSVASPNSRPREAWRLK